jgi:hypothetical protein
MVDFCAHFYEKLYYSLFNFLFFLFVDFFKKKGVAVMKVKELFDFITDPTVTESNMDDYLRKAMEITSNRENMTEKEKVDDEVGKI